MELRHFGACETVIAVGRGQWYNVLDCDWTMAANQWSLGMEKNAKIMPEKFIRVEGRLSCVDLYLSGYWQPGVETWIFDKIYFLRFAKIRLESYISAWRARSCKLLLLHGGARLYCSK